MSFAVIGTAALWLTFVWLASAIVASSFSQQKGFGEKIGLVTGIVLSFIGAAIWAVWPARQISRWRLHGGLDTTGIVVLVVAVGVVVVAGAIAAATIDASTAGRLGVVAVVVMAALIAAALVKSVAITQASGGKTLAELRAERDATGRGAGEQSSPAQ
jgi:hypothetical protein